MTPWWNFSDMAEETQTGYDVFTSVAPILYHVSDDV